MHFVGSYNTNIRSFPFHKFPTQRKLLSSTFLVKKTSHKQYTSKDNHKVCLQSGDLPTLGFPKRANQQVFLHSSYTRPCATRAKSEPQVLRSPSQGLKLSGRTALKKIKSSEVTPRYWLRTNQKSGDNTAAFHGLSCPSGPLHPEDRCCYLLRNQWLRCCATNRKVTGSIPAGVSGFFIDIKFFRSHYGPGSTQPLTEMSIRSISWG